jgi:hypothetical protein
MFDEVKDDMTTSTEVTSLINSAIAYLDELQTQSGQALDMVTQSNESVKVLMASAAAVTATLKNEAVKAQVLEMIQAAVDQSEGGKDAYVDYHFGYIQTIASLKEVLTAWRDHGLPPPPKTLVSIVVLPVGPVAVPVKQHFAFQATGTYSDGSTQIISDVVDWDSSNDAVMTIGPGGSGLSLTSGTCTILASLGDVISNVVEVTVSPTSEHRIFEVGQRVWFRQSPLSKFQVTILQRFPPDATSQFYRYHINWKGDPNVPDTRDPVTEDRLGLRLEDI